MAITAMRRATMTVTPLLTTVDMPRHTMATDIEERTVRPMPTTVAPIIMAAGITIGGITTGEDKKPVADQSFSFIASPTSTVKFKFRPMISAVSIAFRAPLEMVCVVP